MVLLYNSNSIHEILPRPVGICQKKGFFLFLIIEALHFQQKLDETTKLLRELQEAQRERLSAKQLPNMICLLSPTTKELQLGKGLPIHGPSIHPLPPSLSPTPPSCRPPLTPCLPPPYADGISPSFRRNSLFSRHNLPIYIR